MSEYQNSYHDGQIDMLDVERYEADAAYSNGYDAETERAIK